MVRGGRLRQYAVHARMKLPWTLCYLAMDPVLLVQASAYTARLEDRCGSRFDDFGLRQRPTATCNLQRSSVRSFFHDLRTAHCRAASPQTARLEIELRLIALYYFTSWVVIFNCNTCECVCTVRTPERCVCFIVSKVDSTKYVIYT